MRADRAAAYLDMSQTSDANEAISTTAASAEVASIAVWN